MSSQKVFFYFTLYGSTLVNICFIQDPHKLMCLPKIVKTEESYKIMAIWFHFYSESSTGAENYNASVPSGPYHAHHQVQIPTSSPSKAGLEAASGGGGNVLLSPMSVIHSSPLTVSSQATTGGHTVRVVKPTFRYGKHFLYKGGGQGRPSPLQNRWINKKQW